MLCTAVAWQKRSLKVHAYRSWVSSLLKLFRLSRTLCYRTKWGAHGLVRGVPPSVECLPDGSRLVSLTANDLRHGCCLDRQRRLFCRRHHHHNQQQQSRQYMLPSTSHTAHHKHRSFASQNLIHATVHVTAVVLVVAIHYATVLVLLFLEAQQECTRTNHVAVNHTQTKLWLWKRQLKKWKQTLMVWVRVQQHVQISAAKVKCRLLRIVRMEVTAAHARTVSLITVAKAVLIVMSQWHCVHLTLLVTAWGDFLQLARPPLTSRNRGLR